MHTILNTRTKTVHRATESEGGATACGSLAHVPATRTRVVSDDELEGSIGVEYCGNCFEGEGGY